MQFTNIFLSLLLSTAVVAKGNKTTKAVTDKSLCKEMASLEKTVALAANTTKLAEKEKNNATKIAEFEAKASTAATDLATMQSNATLVSTCAVISAAQATENDCEDMTDLQKIIDLAANTTKLAEKANNNATKIAAYQAKASAASVKLATLSSNTTLTDACATMKSAKAEAKAAKGNSTTSGMCAVSRSQFNIMTDKNRLRKSSCFSLIFRECSLSFQHRQKRLEHDQCSDRLLVDDCSHCRWDVHAIDSRSAVSRIKWLKIEMELASEVVGIGDGASPGIPITGNLSQGLSGYELCNVISCSVFDENCN